MTHWTNGWRSYLALCVLAATPLIDPRLGSIALGLLFALGVLWMVRGRERGRA